MSDRETPTFEPVQTSTPEGHSPSWVQCLAPMMSLRFWMVWLAATAIMLGVYLTYDTMGLVGHWYEFDAFYDAPPDSFVPFPFGAAMVGLASTILVLVGTLTHHSAKGRIKKAIKRHILLLGGALLYVIPFVPFVVVFLLLALFSGSQVALSSGSQAFPFSVPFLFVFGTLTTSIGMVLAGVEHRKSFYALTGLAVFSFWAILLPVGDLSVAYGPMNGFAVHVPVLFSLLGQRPFREETSSTQTAESVSNQQYVGGTCLITAGVTWWFVSIAWLATTMFGG